MSDLNVLCAAYSAWEDDDLPALMDMVAEDIVFAVNVPRGSKTYVGKGIGKAAFEAGLRRLLVEWEVIEYRPLWTRKHGFWQRVQVAYCYRERRTGLMIEGTMRHLWRVVGDEIVQLEVHFDHPRMDAFRRLAQAELRV
jgi:ketosteroid isomerase-like protein